MYLFTQQIVSFNITKKKENVVRVFIFSVKYAKDQKDTTIIFETNFTPYTTVPLNILTKFWNNNVLITKHMFLFEANFKFEVFTVEKVYLYLF